MKLSDAMVLGVSRWERTSLPKYGRRYQDSGCLLQLALRAAGHEANQCADWAYKTFEVWPWLGHPDESPHIKSIASMNDVWEPLEDILAYVRMYEPEEVSAPTEAPMVAEPEYATVT